MAQRRSLPCSGAFRLYDNSTLAWPPRLDYGGASFSSVPGARKRSLSSSSYFPHEKYRKVAEGAKAAVSSAVPDATGASTIEKTPLQIDFASPDSESMTVFCDLLLHSHRRIKTCADTIKKVAHLTRSLLPASTAAFKFKDDDHVLQVLRERVACIIADPNDVDPENYQVHAELASNTARDAIISERDTTIMDLRAMIVEKDNVIAEKDSVIAEKDAVISQRNAEVESALEQVEVVNEAMEALLRTFLESTERLQSEVKELKRQQASPPEIAGSTQ